MNWYLVTAFLAATLLVVMTPGPVMAMVVHNTLRHGATAGLLTAAGIGIGELCLFGAMVLSLATFDELFRRVFRWVALAGGLYLVWLAARALWSHCRPAGSGHVPSVRRPMVDGITVAFSNPAALVFYLSFFMQFVDPGRPVFRQMLVLGALYLWTAVCFDFACVLFVSRFRPPATWTRLGRYAELASVAVYLLIAAIAVAEFLGATG